jgi:hypothetical protein
MIAAVRLRVNMVAPNPANPNLSMTNPPITVLNILPILMPALTKLIMVPRLSGTSPRARMLRVVIMIPAAAVPTMEKSIAAVGGKLKLK